MPLRVLQPVQRRRPQRRLPPFLFLLAALVIVAVIAIGRRLTDQHDTGRAVAPRLTESVGTAVPKARTQERSDNILAHRPLSRERLDPPLGASAAIVVSADTGRVVWAAHPRKRLPIASTTKIMTAHLVLERLGLNTVIRVDPGVQRVPLIKEGLRPGERVPVWKLLDGLLLFSGNDDAFALAIAAGRTRANFVRMMNVEAKRLQLRDTHFRSPSGVIDKDNYSTAADLAALTRVALSDSRLRRIVRQRRARVAWAPPTYSKIYVNKNRLLGLYRGANGVKTGWTTKAGHCLVASATRDHRTLISVVLHSPRPYNDAARLLNLGFKTLNR